MFEKFMIIICDTYDYPSYFKNKQSIQKYINELGEMFQAMEIYQLHRGPDKRFTCIKNKP